MEIPVKTSIRATLSPLVVGTMLQAGHRAPRGPWDLNPAIQARKGNTAMNKHLHYDGYTARKGRGKQTLPPATVSRLECSSHTGLPCTPALQTQPQIL